MQGAVFTHGTPDAIMNNEQGRRSISVRKAIAEAANG